MPASPFSVWINILGSVNPSVTRSLTQVNRQLAGLQTQILATNRALVGGFGKLLGLGAGLAGITGIVEAMKQAVGYAKENEQIQEATLVILRNQRELRHENSQLAVQDLKALNEQAISLQQQTGLYKNIFERGSLILAQSRLNLNQIESLQPVMANLLAAQRMQGKTGEQMEQTYKAIGMAIERGMGRSLSRVGVVLTPMEQRILTMNAMVGNIAGNIKIVENAITRTFAGMAKFRMQTLTGRTELAMANMQLSMERIGNALRPIGQRLTIIFTRIIPLIEPVVIRMANLISGFLKQHMKDIAAWMDLIRRRGIPILIEWVDKGWAKLMRIAMWFHENRDWLLAWVRNVSLLGNVIQWEWQRAAVVIKAITPMIKYLVSLFKDLGLGIDAAARNFGSFRQVGRSIEEWLVGTKRLDPHNRGFGYMRAYPKGVVPRAAPVQSGWLFNIVDQINSFIDNEVPKLWHKLTQWMGKFFNTTRDVIVKWFGQMRDWIGSQIKGAVDDITKAFQDIWTAMVKYLTGPLKDLSDLWAKFLSTIFPSRQAEGQIEAEREAARESGALPGGKGRGGTTARTGVVWNPLQHAPIGPAYSTRGAPRGSGYRVFEQYPWEGHAANYNQGVYLGVPDEIGIGTSLQRKYGVRPLRGDWIKVQMADGTTMWRKLLETSERPEGIEFWSPRRNQYLRLGETAKILGVSHGRPKEIEGNIAGMQLGGVVRRPTRALIGEAGPEAVVPLNRAGAGGGLGGVTINYNVTNHIHGGEDLEQRMAAIHRRHIDQLNRDMAEVTYRRNRSALDGAHAI